MDPIRPQSVMRTHSSLSIASQFGDRLLPWLHDLFQLSAEHLTSSKSFDLQNDFVRSVLLLSPIYR